MLAKIINRGYNVRVAKQGLKMYSYVSAVDTAKIIRKELKQNFPLTKFSVRVSKKSGFEGIDIKWIDGYTPSEVSQVINRFKCKEDFNNPHANSIIDNWEGQETIWGAYYLNIERSFSEDFDLEILEAIDISARYLLQSEIPEYKEAYLANNKVETGFCSYFLETRAKYYELIKAQISQHENWRTKRLTIYFDPRLIKARCLVKNLVTDGFENKEIYSINQVQSLVFQLENDLAYEHVFPVWESNEVVYHNDCFSSDITSVTQEIETQPQDITLDAQELETQPQDITSVAQEIETQPQDITLVSQELKTLSQNLAIIEQASNSITQEIKTLKQDLASKRKNISTQFCPKCGSNKTKIHHYPKIGNPRYKCQACGKTFTGQPRGRPKLTKQKSTA